MKIFKTLFLVLCLGFSHLSIGQSVEDYVQEGIVQHDQGNYNKALSFYEKALKLNPKSSLVLYEMAYSYFAKGDYSNGVKYSDKVIKLGRENLMEAYVIKGSCYDHMSKPKKAVKTYKKGLKKTGEGYLLYYNLAVTYSGMGKTEEAIEAAHKAIDHNLTHNSSHYLLAQIHDLNGDRIQAILSSAFFLLIEPNSERSKTILNLYNENLNAGVSKSSTEPNVVNISIPGDQDDEFRSANLYLSMMVASFNSVQSDTIQIDPFVEASSSLFTYLGEESANRGESDDLYWGFYVRVFSDIAESEHMETFCNYIRASLDPEMAKWVEENEEKVDAFSEWLNN